MDMVSDAADSHWDSAQIFDDSTDICEDLRQVFVANLHTVVFDVEDDVYVVFYERASHGGIDVEIVMSGNELPR